MLGLRDANQAQAPALEALQRRSSDVREAYRQQLAANPDAIELPATFIDNGCVRVAVDDTDTPIGFSAAVPTHGQVHELDGLFVEPDHMLGGVGRALVEDAAARASGQGDRMSRGHRRSCASVLRTRRVSSNRRGANTVRPGGAYAARAPTLIAIE